MNFYNTKVNKVKVGYLSLVFLFLFQVFANFNDFIVIYFFSKVVLGLIGMIFCLIYLVRFSFTGKLPPHSVWLIFFFTLLLALATFSSHAVFGQPYISGIIGEVKLTAIFFFFFGLSVLNVAKPNLKEVEAMFVVLGLVCLVGFTMAFILINPQSVYTQGSNLVLKDSKGYRFKFQDVFVVIYLFYSIRRFLKGKKKISMFFTILFILFYEFFYEQERTELACIGLVIIWHIVLRAPDIIRVIFICGVAIILVAIIANPDYFSLLISSVNTSSLDNRAHTFGIADRGVFSSLYHFIFGLGNLNPLWQGGFSRLYGPDFYLSDIGWIGLIYEFGLIGAIFCLLTYFRVISAVKTVTNQLNSLLILSIMDYIMVRLILSIISPIIPYYVGIFVSILAITVYLRRQINHSQNES